VRTGFGSVKLKAGKDGGLFPAAVGKNRSIRSKPPGNEKGEKRCQEKGISEHIRTFSRVLVVVF
jgi:hypothetical protein